MDTSHKLDLQRIAQLLSLDVHDEMWNVSFKKSVGPEAQKLCHEMKTLTEHGSPSSTEVQVQQLDVRRLRRALRASTISRRRRLTSSAEKKIGLKQLCVTSGVHLKTWFTRFWTLTMRS
jgi:hypothetical protein